MNPFTEASLAREIDKRTPGELERLMSAFINRDSRVPFRLREAISADKWASMKAGDRREAARPIVRGQLFDKLVDRYGVRLDSGVVAGGTRRPG